MALCLNALAADYHVEECGWYYLAGVDANASLVHPRVRVAEHGWFDVEFRQRGEHFFNATATFLTAARPHCAWTIRYVFAGPLRERAWEQRQPQRLVFDLNTR